MLYRVFASICGVWFVPFLQGETIVPPPTKEEVKGWNLLGKKKDKKERSQGPERPPGAEPESFVAQPAVIQPAVIQTAQVMPTALPGGVRML